MTSMTRGTADLLLISACIGWAAIGGLIGRFLAGLRKRQLEKEARYADPGEAGQAEDSTAAPRRSGIGWPDNP